jgi:hypothetical protein
MERTAMQLVLTKFRIHDLGTYFRGTLSIAKLIKSDMRSGHTIEGIEPEIYVTKTIQECCCLLDERIKRLVHIENRSRHV